MIATLEGKISEKLGEIVVLDVRGIGYGLLVTAEDFGALAIGEPAKMYIYEHIREQAHDLFGFRRIEVKQLFELLLSVNGVGPKGALSIMSVASSDQVRAAIAGGDTKFIARASGVGKRVAERIIVDLKDKVGLEAGNLGADILSSEASLSQDEAVQALVSLGYTLADASAVLSKIDKTLSTEERIKQALKQ